MIGPSHLLIYYNFNVFILSSYTYTWYLSFCALHMFNDLISKNKMFLFFLESIKKNNIKKYIEITYSYYWPYNGNHNATKILFGQYICHYFPILLTNHTNYEKHFFHCLLLLLSWRFIFVLMPSN